jgi:diguanylate cyclase (GGDEF)-like protein
MSKINLFEGDDVNFFNALIDRLEDQIDYNLNFHRITGLYNRHYFIKNFSNIYGKLTHHHSDIAIALIEIDRFETIYKAFGNSTADNLLKTIGHWVFEWAEQEKLIAFHLDNHKFALIVPNIRSMSSLESQLARFQEEIKRPFIVHQHKIYITASIGACLISGTGIAPEEVLKNGEIVLEQSKIDNTIKINNVRSSDRFDPAYHLVKRLAIESDLFDAITSNQFILHYQPFIDLKTNQIVACEALLRWHHPDHGLIYPNEFISILEETGLIVDVGEWIFQEASYQLKQFQQMGFSNLRMSINLSARQLSSSTFVSSLMDILASYDISPDHVELEITESMIMENIPACSVVLKELHERGIQLALDDFGTGYSTLNILKDFPFNILKIDRSFIKDIQTKPKVNSIVDSLITMGHRLGMKIVAEGVETEQQLKILLKHDCDYAQGYFFSKPLSKEDLIDYLGSFKSKS